MKQSTFFKCHAAWQLLFMWWQMGLGILSFIDGRILAGLLSVFLYVPLPAIMLAFSLKWQREAEEREKPEWWRGNTHYSLDMFREECRKRGGWRA